HQHMHVLPTVLPIVIEQAKQYGINAIRIPDESSLFVNYMYSPVRLLGKVGLSTVAAKARPTIRDNGMYSTQYFWGMVNGGHINQKTLMGILKSVSKKSGTHELMIHPGLNNTLLGNQYKWGYHWEDELQAVCSNHTHLYIRQHNIELINYGDLI
ncbi:MAG: ChbG/HpnK family deacetylase, partial [Veillonella sp.]